MFNLERIGSAKIGVIGDFALDIYWHADMKKSELSRETPHFPLPVERERIYLGAAGNVAANLAALQPARLLVCGVCGDDWRGSLMQREFEKIGADTRGLIVEPGRMTNAYCKPLRRNGDVEYEDPRIDFAAQTPPSDTTENAVLEWIDWAEGELDVLCVCDQFTNGIITDNVRELLCACSIPVIADSRSQIGRFKNITVKPNEQECAAALKSLGLAASADDEQNARALAEATNSRVLLTLGERGSLYIDGETIIRTPAVRWDGPVDFCGAGDTFLSAFAAMTAAGASPAEAARYASAASSTTIRKLGITGTATRDEIRALLD